MPHATALPTFDPRGHVPRHEIAAMTFLARYRGSTLQNYGSILKCFFEWCAQVDVDPLEAHRAHLELFVRHCERDLKNHPSTITDKIGVLRGYYKYAELDDMIMRNPATHVRTPRWFRDETAIVGLSRTEMNALISCAQASTPVEEALIVLLGVLALRVHEACNVRIEDFGEKDREHTVLRLIGKGHKAATIPLPPGPLRALRRAAGDRRSGHLLLRDSNGMPMTQKASIKIVRRLALQAGITKPVRNHTLRHSAITAALDAGVPLRMVQVGARHSDPRTTTRYDRARMDLDKHPIYITSAYLMGGA